MATEEFRMTAEELQKKTELEKREGRTCYLIKTCGLAVWFGEPSIDDIDIFMSDVADSKTKGSGILDLARRNVVEPQVDRAKDPNAHEPFKSRPAAIVPMANAYAKACGVTADALLGK